MDYMMPEMDGLEACQAIVNNPATSSIPVIMTTSNDTPEFRKRGVSSGARGFLSKGLEDRELDNVLDSVAESQVVEKPSRGVAMEPGRVELDEKTLSMIRDQAMNAARRASEEYFTSQLPGLEEQVIQVAENAARHALGDKPAAQSQHGGSVADEGAIRELQQKVDNIYNDKQLRSAIQRIVREEAGRSGGTGAARRASEEPRKSSGLGRFIRNLLILLVILVAAYAIVVIGFPDTPLAIKLNEIVGRLLEAVNSRI